MAELELPSYEERLLVAGSNGTGKTVFLRALLGAGYPRWVVVDFKGNFQPPQNEQQPYVVVRDPRDRRLVSADRVLYRVAPQYRTRRELEYAFARIYHRGDVQARQRGKHFVCIVDEALAIARTRATLWLGNLAVVGREWGVGLWVASQRLRWIPVEVKSEAHRWYLFWLADEADEVEALRFAKGELTLDQLREYTGQPDPQGRPHFVELRRGHSTGGRVVVTAYPPVREPKPERTARAR